MTHDQEHEYHVAVRRLRKAAERIVHAEGDEDLREAVKDFSEAQVGWYNSIPRDARNMPVAA